MDSKRSQADEVQSKWADLPVELLGLISGRLQNNGEVFGFRSVCRSWRSSTAPLPNKLSPSFPLKHPSFDGSLMNVCALYLVRPRSDPSKAWIVSVQEAEAGKLVLRHALTYREINSSDDVLRLDENRIVATLDPIAGFYAYNEPCEECKGVKFTRKVVFVSGASSSSSSSSGCRELVGLCSSPKCNQVLVWGYPCEERMAFTFRLDLGSEAFKARWVSGEYAESMHCHRFEDSVKFNGRIFLVYWDGYIYVHDRTNLQLVRMTQEPVRVPYEEGWGAHTRVEFVVSNGDLYVAWYSCRPPSPSACEIYRLVVATDERDECSAISVERVWDLGDRVFFFMYQCSFSVSARLLPHPWRDGNCVVISDFDGFNCRCVGDVEPFRVSVFNLATQTFTIPYSDLFSPPTSFDVEDHLFSS